MKINNGKELTRKDKKIWNTVTRGIKPEQAKAAVAAALAIPLNSDTTTTGTDTAAIKHKPLLHVNTPNTTSTTSSSPHPTKTGTNSPNKTKPSRRQSMGGSADRKAGLGLRSSLRSSGGAIASGLNALSTSMKKRLGLTVITTATDGEDHETSYNTEGSPNKNTMKNKTFSKTPTTTTPTEFINPRGTNISITPKPRSYLTTSKPKNIASSKPDKTNENHNNNFPTQDSINNTTTTTNIVNTIDNEKLSSGKSGKVSGTDTEGNSGKPGITSMLTAFSTSFKETFSFKRSVSSIKGSRNTTGTAGAGAAYNIDIDEENEEKLHGGDDDFNSSTPTATMTAKPSSSSIIASTGATSGSAVSPGKSPKGVHFTGSGQQSHSAPHSTLPSPVGTGRLGHSVSHSTLLSPVGTSQQSHSTPPSPAGKGRILPASSPKISNSNGNNSNHNISSSSNSNIELTPEQYRDRILQQQSLQTASSLQAVNEHIQEHDEEYNFNKDIGSKKRSPIEDFFNSMSPFGRSASVLPSSPSHNRVLPSD